MNLNFIGTGSAFNTKLGNTSAFIRCRNSMLLIDCGGTVFHRLTELKLLEGLKQLNIVITHTNPDHVGSLGDLIFFSYFTLGIVPKLYFPDADWIKGFLHYIGVEDNMYELSGSMTAEISIRDFDRIKLSFIPVPHLPALPAFGFVFVDEGRRYYYSGDANGIPESILYELKNGTLETIYQDTCGLEYEGNAHLSLGKLCEAIPEGLREKVCCIHHDGFLDIEKVKEAGFKLPLIYTI
jgi:phosphoribosyl 1,2-cyclic phosphodiesterase